MRLLHLHSAARRIHDVFYHLFGGAVPLFSIGWPGLPACVPRSFGYLAPLPWAAVGYMEYVYLVCRQSPYY